MAARDILQAASGATGKLYVDDVFSTYLYNGNGTTQTINNGIDLAGNGGMVWTKARSSMQSHFLASTVLGTNNYISTDSTAALTATNNYPMTATSSGYNLTAATFANNSGVSYTSWTFRNAPKFFTHTTKSHTTGTSSTVDLSSLGTVGMVVVKRTDSTGDWLVWNAVLGFLGENIKLNTTAASTTLNAWLSVSGTTATLASAAPTGTYVIYAWAHDTSSEGVVKCGSYTGNGSSTGPVVTLGWEPQFLLIKNVGIVSPWEIIDLLRGFTVGGVDSTLSPNSTAAETFTDRASPTATGFQPTTTSADWNALNNTYIYLAIRRPNKPPTSGTQVFSPVTSAAVTGTAVSTGFPIDLQIFKARSVGDNSSFVDRLRGVNTTTTLSSLPRLDSTSTTAETSATTYTNNWGSTGFAIPGTQGGASSAYWNFRRAPGFMDIVCYTHTGSVLNVPHQLGVRPEFVIYKTRNAIGLWAVHARVGNNNWASGLYLEQSIAGTTGNTFDSIFTSSQVYVSSATAGTTGVAYLFATLPGISKVGSYTGNGSSQTIDCGFSTGARFILIKRTDSTGDWYVWDTARGIIAGNDPHLSTNTTAAEVTTDDSVDPDNSGFIVNQLAATNINVTSATYIFLAVA